jgi:gamma-glutamylaminecyclotransferase
VEHLVFVYGTLKEGFRNFHINHGRRVGGEFVTVQRHALMLVGPAWLPWLLEDARAEPGEPEGHHVIGQIYAVNDAALAAMDQLEQLEDEGWYLRRRINVQPLGEPDAPALQPWVYFGSREGMLRDGRRGGPFDSFTEAHQALLPREFWPKG